MLAWTWAEIGMVGLVLGLLGAAILAVSAAMKKPDRTDPPWGRGGW